LEKLILSKELRESIGLQAYNEAMENHVTIKTGTGLRDFIMHKLNKNICTPFYKCERWNYGGN